MHLLTINLFYSLIQRTLALYWYKHVIKCMLLLTALLAAYSRNEYTTKSMKFVTAFMYESNELMTYEHQVLFKCI